jgi:hypothetical protein
MSGAARGRGLPPLRRFLLTVASLLAFGVFVVLGGLAVPRRSGLPGAALPGGAAIEVPALVAVALQRSALVRVGE